MVEVYSPPRAIGFVEEFGLTVAWSVGPIMCNKDSNPLDLPKAEAREKAK